MNSLQKIVRKLCSDFFEFINTKACSIFHYWIQYQEFRILNPSLFSVMNSYLEFISMNLYMLIQSL